MNENIDRRGNNKISEAGSKWMSGKVKKGDKQPDLQCGVHQSLGMGVSIPMVKGVGVDANIGMS